MKARIAAQRPAPWELTGLLVKPFFSISFLVRGKTNWGGEGGAIQLSLLHRGAATSVTVSEFDVKKQNPLFTSTPEGTHTHTHPEPGPGEEPPAQAASPAQLLTRLRKRIFLSVIFSVRA